MSWAALAGIVGLLTALVTLMATLGNRVKINEVHVLVNSQMTHALARIEQLEIALESSDTEVPADPNPNPKGKTP